MEGYKVCLVQQMTNESNQEMIRRYLEIARSKILNRLYPFGYFEYEPVPDRYFYKQVEIASFLLNKRGAEGQTAHSENGISRSYENGDVPSSMLQDIVPCASVLLR